MKVFQGYLMLHRETVSILTDKGAITKYDAHTGIQSGSVQSAMHERSTYIAKELQAFWLGYSQRCQYSDEKLSSMPHLRRDTRLIITFYAAMNSFRGLMKKYAHDYRKSATIKMIQSVRGAAGQTNSC